MATSNSFIPASELPVATRAGALPRGCTFTESDWKALAPYWYPVALSRDITNKPYAARLLEERVVVYRLSDGSIIAARDICYHRGAPLSLGHVEDDEIICRYHGLRYDKEGRCVCIPAHPGGAISPRLHLDMFQAQERYGLVWVRLVDNGPLSLPEMKEWEDPDYLQVLPEVVAIEAAAGRQVEGFLDVSHFAFVHKESFGEPLADPGPVEDFYIAKRIRKVVLHTMKEKDDDKGKEAQRIQFWTVEASIGSGHEVMLPTEILQAGLRFSINGVIGN